MDTKKYIYITLKDIQENLENHYQRTGKKLSFVTALENVYHLGRFMEHQTKHPDYKDSQMISSYLFQIRKHTSSLEILWRFQ